MVAVDSPDYFQPIPGGDLFPTGDETLQPPVFNTGLDTSESQDGTTGDPWAIIGQVAGVAGSFLKTFTGSNTVGVKPPAPKPPTTAAAGAGNSTTLALMIGGALLLIVLVLVLGKK